MKRGTENEKNLMKRNRRKDKGEIKVKMVNIYIRTKKCVRRYHWREKNLIFGRGARLPLDKIPHLFRSKPHLYPPPLPHPVQR
jgi:hypothetical protein